MKRVAWLLGLAIAVAAVLFLAVFPTRALIDQRRERGQVADHVRQLDADNARLDNQVRLLHTDAEIERLARSQYDLVRPGEEAYAILPPPATTTTVPGRR